MAYLRNEAAIRIIRCGHRGSGNEFRFENLSDLPRVMNKQQQGIKEERKLGKAPLSQMLIYIDDMLGDLRRPSNEIFRNYTHRLVIA